MSDIAPMDILGKKFSKKLHGYAEMEVHEYLTDLARAMEALIRERGELKQRLHHREQELSAYVERESKGSESSTTDTASPRGSSPRPTNAPRTSSV